MRKLWVFLLAFYPTWAIADQLPGDDVHITLIYADCSESQRLKTEFKSGTLAELKKVAHYYEHKSNDSRAVQFIEAGYSGPYPRIVAQHDHDVYYTVNGKIDTQEAKQKILRGLLHGRRNEPPPSPTETPPEVSPTPPQVETPPPPPQVETPPVKSNDYTGTIVAALVGALLTLFVYFHTSD